jgi:nucleoside 2-deoxyribosyltransferase
MIYLCSPYTHPDPAVVQRRFDAVCRAAAELIRQGQIVFSPVAHSHPIARYGLPGNWAFWQRQDLALLAACDELVVLKLDGWQHSRGVQAEIAAAKALGKPVAFVDPQTLCAGTAAA